MRCDQNGLKIESDDESDVRKVLSSWQDWIMSGRQDREEKI